MAKKPAQVKAKQSRSTREKLDWSESSASEGHQAAKACKVTKRRLRLGDASSGATNTAKQQLAGEQLSS